MCSCSKPKKVAVKTASPSEITTARISQCNNCGHLRGGTSCAVLGMAIEEIAGVMQRSCPVGKFKAQLA